MLYFFRACFSRERALYSLTRSFANCGILRGLFTNPARPRVKLRTTNVFSSAGLLRLRTLGADGMEYLFLPSKLETMT